MIEGANRNPDVAELMHCHGYFHAVRAKGYLVPHPGPTDMNDGFWVHPDKSDGYRAAGILRGPDPPGVCGEICCCDSTGISAGKGNGSANAKSCGLKSS
ncbi:hypothetical protein B4Q13_15185, partial [Lacticaseibacillus rhamnosus]